LRHAERTVAYFMPIAQLTCRAAIKPMSNNSLGPPEGVLNNLPDSVEDPGELVVRLSHSLKELVEASECCSRVNWS
jgi:hypothetical protein